MGTQENLQARRHRPEHDRGVRGVATTGHAPRHGDPRGHLGLYTTLYDKRDALAEKGKMGEVRRFPNVDSVLADSCKYGTYSSTRDTYTGSTE